MEKKRRYVSVQAGTIMENQGDAAYELEIDATEEEVQMLRRLFQERLSHEYDTFLRAHVPAVPYHFDMENDMYDESLKEIYALIYKLGTEETRNHIQQMASFMQAD
jgi:hypothetical protein